MFHEEILNRIAINVYFTFSSEYVVVINSSVSTAFS